MIIKEILDENTSVCQKNADLLPAISEAQSVPEGKCPVVWCRDMVMEARSRAAGKSVMCRDGLWQLQLMLEGIMKGQSGEEDLAVMKETLDAMELVGCPDSKKVAQLIKANMEAYASEWDGHVRRRRCASLQCFYSLYIDPAVCKGNGACLKACPAGAVVGGEGMISVIKDDSGLKSEAFIACCPNGAIKKYGGPVKPRTPSEPVPVGSFSADAGAAAGGGGRRRRRG